MSIEYFKQKQRLLPLHRQNEKSNSSKNILNISSFLYKRIHKCPGFSNNNVPRTDSAQKIPQLNKSVSSYNLYHNKILKGISVQMKPTKQPKEFYERLVEENSKCMKALQILNKSKTGKKLPLIKSTSRDVIFSYSYNLKGSSKYFGEKYNPHNYDPDSHINRTQRNQNGTLFQH